MIVLTALTAISTVQTKAADLKTSINAIVKSYLDIKNALAADNAKAANDAAKSFTIALKDIQPDQMDASQKASWNKYAEKLRYDGDHISESAELAHQREHFGSLSANLYAVLKTFKDNESPLYQQYCPMAKKTWLSEISEIKNPYLGKQMPGCGVTWETLKAAK
jgi:hypothetical protein